MWSTDVDEHRRYLSDQTRMEAFEAAIREVVRPGDVVLDLGTGTGILGLLACRAEAGRVYSVERGSMIEVARRICTANGFQDRVVFLKGLSTRLDLPEKVDVVVADQLDGAGYEAGLVQYFGDAKARFLKPGGRMIPSRIDFCLAAVQFDEQWQDVAFWQEPKAGISLEPVYELATNVAYAVNPGCTHLLSNEVVGQTIEFSQDIPSNLAMAVTLAANRSGVMHGLLCWFRAQLSDGVVLTNSPMASQRAQRRCMFLPLRGPVEVSEGDELVCTVKAPVGQQLVHWSVLVRSGRAGTKSDIARSVHSTFKGTLLCQEEIVKTAPDYAPQLSAEGDALLTALRLLKTGCTVAEVETHLRAEHNGVFRSQDDYSAFVADLVRKHSI